MHRHHEPGYVGVMLHHLGEVFEVDGGRADLAIECDVLDFRDQPGVIVARKEGAIYAKGFGDAVEHGEGKGAHVVFDLVDVAGRKSQRMGERGLAEVAFAAELAKA